MRMRSQLVCALLNSWRTFFLLFALSFVLVISQGHGALAADSPAGIDSIEVSNAMLGQSTEYIGACEGNVNFDLADLEDLNINTYRIYGGMSRWESEDDDGVYGWPAIAQIKQDPDLISWQRWDAVMSAPPFGSDYAFSGNPSELWQGSAQTIFESLKQKNIRPVVSIRNNGIGQNPVWARALDPPRSQADWNEWWEHVFATVYWLNVRNDYQVDDFEIHNEPDNPPQGWDGTQKDYFELVQVAADAISHVYSTYLPGRTFHIHAPKTTGGSVWPKDTLAAIPAYFDSVNVHNYDWNTSDYVKQVRGWMNRSVHALAPLWIGEWGTYTTGYNNLAFSLNLLKNMIRMSQPGDTYVYGSHIFSLYNWGRDSTFQGLINAEGDRTLSYYAFRMGIRALQGGRDVLNTTSSHPDLMAIATKSESTTSLLVVNTSPVDHTISASFSDIDTMVKASIREFSQTNLDTVVEEANVKAGILLFNMPANTSRLVSVNVPSTATP